MPRDLRPSQPYRASMRGLLALGSAVLSACSTLRPLPTPLPDSLPLDKSNEVRLTLTSGTVVHLVDARMSGDSVVGLDINAKRDQSARFAVHRSDIKEVAVRRGDHWKTFAAATAGTLALLSIVAVVACAAALGGMT
jgi:hypothetical protein